MRHDDTLDDAIDDVRDAASEFLNSEGRSVGYVALGYALTAGFALLATAVATQVLAPPKPARRVGPLGLKKSAPPPPRPSAMSLLLPAVFSATTLSAVRVWNAPPTKDRSAAMGLWLGAQTLNAIWLAMRPASLRLQVIAAMSSAGLAAAFDHEARKIEKAPARKRR